MQIHCITFKGKYSERTLDQYSARAGAVSNLFHLAVTREEVLPQARPHAVGSVVGGRRYRGLLVAVFDSITPDEATKRVQAYLQERN